MENNNNSIHYCADCNKCNIMIGTFSKDHLALKAAQEHEEKCHGGEDKDTELFEIKNIN